MNIKIVLFDGAGVLFPSKDAVIKDISRKLKINEDYISKKWGGIYLELSEGSITTREYLDKFALMFSLEPTEVTEEFFTDPFKKELEPMPGMDALLANLAKTELTLSMLSDTTKMYADVREKLGYYKYFKKRFFSYKTGYLKPDPRAYKCVLDYYKIPPEEVFFIDDKPNNIAAAHKMGMKGVVFENTSKLSEDLRKAGIIGVTDTKHGQGEF